MLADVIIIRMIEFEMNIHYYYLSIPMTMGVPRICLRVLLFWYTTIREALMGLCKPHQAAHVAAGGVGGHCMPPAVNAEHVSTFEVD
jgi:hypothetical protein